MESANEIVVDLGNKLLRIYCPDCIHNVLNVSKWTFRDQLISKISKQWNIDYDQLPSEETFYRAFRKGACSSAMKEKLALFYYAMVDSTIAGIMNKEYNDIHSRQRIQSLPYWNRFSNEFEMQAINPFVLPTSLEGSDKKQLEQLITALDQSQIQSLLNIITVHLEEMSLNSKLKNKISQLEQSHRYEEADTILAGIAHNSREELASICYQRAGLKFIQIKYKDALDLYSQAVHLQPTNISYQKGLADMQYELDLMDDCIETLQTIISLLNQNKQGTSILAGEIFRSLAQIWHKKGDYKMALSYAIKAQSIYKQNPECTSDKIAEIHNVLGCLSLVHHDFRKAYRHFKKAYSGFATFFGENYNEVATVCYNIGSSLEEMRKMKAALYWMEKALKIDLSLYGEYHPSIATHYNSFGLYWMEMDKCEDALFCLQKSRMLFESIYGECHVETATTYENIGGVLTRLNKPKAAIKYFQKSKKIYTGILPRGHKKFGLYYTHMAGAYAKMNNFNKAIQFAQKAIAIFERHFKNSHPYILKTKRSIANFKRLEKKI